jgi:hypothetical protein
MEMIMTRLCTTIGVLMLVASPALAQPFHNGLDRPWPGPHGIEISAKRAHALRECNAVAADYPEYLWGNMASYQYRACMTEHGEVE